MKILLNQSDKYSWARVINSVDIKVFKLEYSKIYTVDMNLAIEMLSDAKELAENLEDSDSEWLLELSRVYAQKISAMLQSDFLTRSTIRNLYNACYYGTKEAGMHELINRVRINRIAKANEDDEINERFLKFIESDRKRFSYELVVNKENLAKTVEESEELLSKLKEEAGKVAAKNYAGIFANQSKVHSNANDWRVWNWGSAEYWLIVGLILIALVFKLLFNLDDYLIIDDYKSVYYNIAHLASRAIIVSVFLFLISFSFKQYRVQKHLATLNIHRANTLNSYEYLSAALDKSDGSANAILMKVAETIYASGQTGYVYDSESRGDLPTLIDMSKIINPGKES